MDGVTVGHLCCSIHNCKTPLANQRHRFCPEHASQHDDQCAIEGCDNRVVSGTLACDLVEHRQIWARHDARGKAHFMLRARLQRARMAGAGFDGDIETLDADLAARDPAADVDG